MAINKWIISEWFPSSDKKKLDHRLAYYRKHKIETKVKSVKEYPDMRSFWRTGYVINIPYSSYEKASLLELTA